MPFYKVVKQTGFFLYFSLSGSAEQDEPEGSDGRSLGSQEGNKAENPSFKNGMSPLPIPPPPPPPRRQRVPKRTQNVISFGF